MITVICSTNRKDAITFKIAELYKSKLIEQGMEADILDLAQLPQDFVFSALYENTGKNASFNVFQDQLDKVEKMVFIVPEYNGSFPGVLKAFMDGLKYPGLNNKKAALVALSSGSMGGALALSHLTDILNYLEVSVLPLKLKLAGIENLLKDGQLNDSKALSMMDHHVKAFIKF